MNVLVFGGTGAMGVPVVRHCSELADVYVTSRREHEDSERIHYLVGNAHSVDFLKKDVFCRHYDVIIDFMTYSTDEFRSKVDLFLEATDRYVFLSSARVYADSDQVLTEDAPRILDTCTDNTYLATDEYALAKARCEDILKQKKENNWTIVRPYITYNSQRLQLGVYEKENWLRRYLDGHTIVIPKDIMNKETTLTYGEDVAYRIATLAMSREAQGQVFNVSNPQSFLWGDILQIIDKLLFEITGNKLKVRFVEDSVGLQKVWHKYQIIYDRLYSRRFDNSKQEAICGGSYIALEDGLSKCLRECIENPQYAKNKIKAAYEGWSDRMTGEHTSISSISGHKDKLRYLRRRYFF